MKNRIDGLVPAARARARLFAALLAFSILAVLTVPAARAAAPPPLVTPQQLTVTAANAAGDSVYDLTLNTGVTNGALINGVQTLNSDGGKHGSFDALVWVPNAFTGTLDLLVADATRGQILRYAGPAYGTATPLFTYTTKGSGPAFPTGLAADPAGNLFVIAPNSPLGAAPGVWVLPFNKATGGYGAPVLVDQTFGGAATLALAEILVAGTAATPDGSAAPAWHAGDLLVLVGDTFDSRLIVYSQAAIAGLLANPKAPLKGPTSTAISSKQFLSEVAVPFGMDLWPADATHGVSVLVTTIDGRILRFDSAQNAFTTNFAAGLGLALQKIKVGRYAGTPYAFAAQLTPLPNGQILQFGAPPASGTNKPIATISKGVSAPVGLALVNSGSAPASSCVFPASCSPLGPELTLQISGPGAANIPAGATLLQQSCTVLNDPRVSVVGGTWSCLGPTINVCGNPPAAGCVPATLDVANYCPGFPSTILPPSMCGHSGASGAGFAVIKATATLLDENDNDLYLQSSVNIAAVLPGPYDLPCQSGPGQYGSLLAFAPRSDLPSIEGRIVEDQTAPYFTELTGSCDEPGGNTHVESMFAFGLGLNASASGLGTGSSGGLFGFVTNKFSNLQTTIANYSPQITPATVTTTLENYVTQSQTYFNNDYKNDLNGYSCALNSIAAADIYLRHEATTNAFSYSAPAAGNNNPNPAGAIDARLANLYLTISGDFLAMPNPTWPASSVPPCVTLTASVPSVGTGGSATLIYGPPTPQFANTPLSFAPTQCTLSASDGSFVVPTAVGSTGTVSTGLLTKPGTYTATLDCNGPAGDTSMSLATASIAVTSAPTLQSIGLSPATAAIAAGLTQPFTASGTSSAQTPYPLTAVAWSAANSGNSVGQAAVASITSAGVAQCLTVGTAKISAMSAGVTGTAALTCQAATLASIAVPAAPQAVPAGQSYPFQAAGTSTLNTPFTLTSVAWSAVNSGSSVGQATVASINSTGVAQCLTPGTSTITALSSGISGSTTLICAAAPSATLVANAVSVLTGTKVLLTWNGSGLPSTPACTLTSNSSDAPLNLANLTPTGSANTTENVAQTVTYTFSCPGLPTAATTNVTYTLQTTYQYTGNTFTSSFAPYTASDAVIASITLNAPLAPNLLNFYLPNQPGYQLTMSDGVQTLSSANSYVSVSTDANGNIIGPWTVGIGNQSVGISTQYDNGQAYGFSGTDDVGYQVDENQILCVTDCGDTVSSPGTWSSTNAQSLHVVYGTAPTANPPAAQLREVIVNGAAATPTLNASTLLSEMAEPTNCATASGTGQTNAATAVTSLAFVPNATSGLLDLLGANSTNRNNNPAAHVFRISGPSYQPTTDVNDASASCFGTGPNPAAIAADGSGDLIAVGSDVKNTTTPAVYLFPATQPGTVPNFVLIDNVNADTALTGACHSSSGSATANAGCVTSLADAVVAPAAVTGTDVAAGDLLVLVGDGYAGNGNAVVMRIPAAAIGAAQSYPSNCPASYGNTTGQPPACVATSGGSQLVTQATLTGLASGEAPVSMDISPIDGSLLIATSLGNIYQLEPTASGYGPPQLYAVYQFGIQRIRAAQRGGYLYLFATELSDGAFLGVYVGTPPTGGFQYPTASRMVSQAVAISGLAVH